LALVEQPSLRQIPLGTQVETQPLVLLLLHMAAVAEIMPPLELVAVAVANLAQVAQLVTRVPPASQLLETAATAAQATTLFGAALVAAAVMAAQTGQDAPEEMLITAAVVAAVLDKARGQRAQAARVLAVARVARLQSAEPQDLARSPQAAVAGLAAGHPVLAARAA
jgi:hypothetical protein